MCAINRSARFACGYRKSARIRVRSAMYRASTTVLTFMRSRSQNMHTITPACKQ
jgi:hypothetical protein